MTSTAGIFALFALVFTALYPTADPTTQAGCNPGHIVPLINFHGLTDTTITFDGQASNHGNTSCELIPRYVWLACFVEMASDALRILTHGENNGPCGMVANLRTRMSPTLSPT
jgi:hypothetical protein